MHELPWITIFVSRVRRFAKAFHEWRSHEWKSLANRITSSVRTRQNFQARALGDFHDRVSSAARAWGHKFSSEAMHVYMGENRFSLWSYHIGTVFKRSQLSFDIYKVSNHHLIHDIHQMTSGLPNLYKFQWAITSSLSYVEYWPENIKTVLLPCGG